MKTTEIFLDETDYLNYNENKGLKGKQVTNKFFKFYNFYVKLFFNFYSFV